MAFKRIGFLIILTFVAACFLSCQNRTEPADSAETADTTQYGLSFRITWADYSGRGQAIQKIVDSYNATVEEDARVRMIGGDEDLETIRSMFASDPETVFVLPYRYVEYFGNLGDLADLTSGFTAEKSLYYPAVWSLGTVNGETYGIPWIGHSMCLLYNKELLKAAGVDPASIQSLKTLVSAMEAVERETGAKGIGLVGADSNDVSWMVNQFIYGFGGKLVDESGKKVLVNSQQAADALDFYRNTLGAHAQPTWLNDTGVEVMKHFLNQEIAFEIQGIWGITDVQKNGAPFSVGMIPLQQIGVCAEIGPMMLSIPDQMSERGKERANAFIRYMISMEAQQAILNGEYSPEHDTYYPFRTPIRIDMADTPVMQMNPEYQLFIEGFQNPSVDVPVPEWQEIKQQYYEPGLHRVMTGEESIEGFLSMIETEGNWILS